MSGTDHHVGITNHCPFCGSRWGGLIPRMHTIGCTRNAPENTTTKDGDES